MKAHKTDILLIGGGIMSKTLATLVSQLDPSRQITLVEQSAAFATESTDSWNNAGTRHAGYCELNYTPRRANGEVDIARALTINARFEESLQFWSGLVQKGALPEPARFINRVPHLSWVEGTESVEFLRARRAALSAHPLFDGMDFTDDTSTLEAWLPLMMEGRGGGKPMAATRVGHGTDVDFGAITRFLGDYLARRGQVDLRTRTTVTGLHREANRWMVTTDSPQDGTKVRVRARRGWPNWRASCRTSTPKSGNCDAQASGYRSSSRMQRAAENWSSARRW